MSAEWECQKFQTPIFEDFTYLDNNGVLGSIADSEAAATGTTCDVLWKRLLLCLTLFTFVTWPLRIFIEVKILAEGDRSFIYASHGDKKSQGSEIPIKWKLLTAKAN